MIRSNPERTRAIDDSPGCDLTGYPLYEISEHGPIDEPGGNRWGTLVARAENIGLAMGWLKNGRTRGVAGIVRVEKPDEIT